MSNASQLQIPNAKLDPRGWLNAAAEDQGFLVVGIGPASIGSVYKDGLSTFLNNAFEGDMDWLRTTAAKRMQPQNMWPDAKSAIVFGMNYGPDHDPMDNLAARTAGNISVYARGRDYHDVLKKKLRRLARQIAKDWSCEVKLFVDTAPVMEKPLAALAGLGWQGKHTNLVSRTFGSWVFLGEIFTTLDLAPDMAESDHCGSCRKCLDVCPTDAFPTPYQLDARRCISYLTIELKGSIPEEFRPMIGNRIYGCDDSLAACPWNRFAGEGRMMAEHHRLDLGQADLLELLALDGDGFRAKFRGTPMKRTKRRGVLRNVCVALGNVGDAAAIPALERACGDPEPLIAEHAEWALGQVQRRLGF